MDFTGFSTLNSPLITPLTTAITKPSLMLAVSSIHSKLSTQVVLNTTLPVSQQPLLQLSPCTVFLISAPPPPILIVIPTVLPHSTPLILSPALLFVLIPPLQTSWVSFWPSQVGMILCDYPCRPLLWQYSLLPTMSTKTSFMPWNSYTWVPTYALATLADITGKSITGQLLSFLDTCTGTVSISPAVCPLYNKDWSESENNLLACLILLYQYSATLFIPEAIENPTPILPRLGPGDS